MGHGYYDRERMGSQSSGYRWSLSRTRWRGVRWGDIEVMRRGGVAERVIGTACAAQDCGSREASISRSRSCQANPKLKCSTYD